MVNEEALFLYNIYILLKLYLLNVSIRSPYVQCNFVFVYTRYINNKYSPEMLYIK